MHLKKNLRPPNILILNKNEVLTGASLPLFGTARVDLRIWDLTASKIDTCPFGSYFVRSLHFLALVFATISLVCFFAVPVFRGLVMPLIKQAFQQLRARIVWTLHRH